jgi:hypothetical protein
LTRTVYRTAAFTQGNLSKEFIRAANLYQTVTTRKTLKVQKELELRTKLYNLSEEEEEEVHNSFYSPIESPIELSPKLKTFPSSKSPSPTPETSEAKSNPRTSTPEPGTTPKAKRELAKLDEFVKNFSVIETAKINSKGKARQTDEEAEEETNQAKLRAAAEEEWASFTASYRKDEEFKELTEEDKAEIEEIVKQLKLNHPIEEKPKEKSKEEETDELLAELNEVLRKRDPAQIEKLHNIQLNIEGRNITFGQFCFETIKTEALIRDNYLLLKPELVGSANHPSGLFPSEQEIFDLITLGPQLPFEVRWNTERDGSGASFPVTLPPQSRNLFLHPENIPKEFSQPPNLHEQYLLKEITQLKTGQASGSKNPPKKETPKKKPVPKKPLHVSFQDLVNKTKNNSPPDSPSSSSSSSSDESVDMAGTGNGNDLRNLVVALTQAFTNINTPNNQPKELTLQRPEVFEGKESEDPKDWIEAFERISSANNWAREQKLEHT